MRALLWLVLCTCVGGELRAQTLLDTTLTIGKEPDAAELSFFVPAAGSYRLTLTDFGTTPPPPRLARVDAGVLRGSELVTKRSLTAADATGVGTATFTAAAGENKLVVVGQPNAPTARVGSAGVRIEDPATGVVVLDTLRAFAVPAPAAGSPATFEHEVAVPPGAYLLKVTDFALPAPLATMRVTVVRRSDGAIVADASSSTDVALATGVDDTFEVFVFASLAGGVPRGLLGFHIRDAGNGTVRAAEIHELGAWPHRYGLDVTEAATLHVSVADLGFPAPLSSVRAEVVRDGQRVSSRVLPGVPVDFAATPGSYAVYVDAVPATAGGAGSFGLRASSPTGTLLEEVQAVVAAGQNGDIAGIDTDFDVAVAGDYTLTLTDFGTSGFFDPFTSVSLALTRDDQLVTRLDAPGQLTFAATPGRYSVAILADPAGTAGEGLVGVRVVSAAGGAPVLDFTEAVGASFMSATFDVPSAMRVEVRSADLGFPAPFASLRMAVTRGAQRVGEIVGTGVFSFEAEPGSYRVNALAATDPQVGYGTLGITGRILMPPPVVTLSPSAASVPVGDSVTLSWSAVDATACNASGGWNGTRATSGSESIALSANATFTLRCNGLGGSDEKSVAVTVTAAERSSGGGAIDVAFLALLAVGCCLGRRRSGSARR